MQPDWWKYVVDVAQILSAIGTCAASIIAVWLALKRPTLHISGTVGIRLIIANHIEKVNGSYPEYVVVSVTNNGAIEFTVRSFAWKGGYRSKVHAMQIMGHNDMYVQSSPLPHKLALGEDVHFFLPTYAEESWLQRISSADNFFSKSFATRRSLESLRLVVLTSVGVSHELKPEKKVLDAIWERIQADPLPGMEDQ